MTTTHRENNPLTWVVLGDKQGDNAQVEAIEQALPWPCEHRHIQVLDEYVFGKPKVGPTLYHIDRERSDPLEPPWPDLILTIGRRPANVALWIREQSGGHTKIVIVGKPSSMPGDYDLVIYSAENQFPPRANLQGISLPLMRIDAAAIDAAAEIWEPRLADLPRPLTVFLVGGPTGPFIFNDTAIRRLLSTINRVLEETHGSVYITTSRRTPPAVVEALQNRLPEGALLFTWTADAHENPYRGLLGLADGFVVTGDSISMMVEVIRLRKPLAIFPLPVGKMGAVDQLRRTFTRWLFAPASGNTGDRLRTGLCTLLYTMRIVTHTRDFTAFNESLVRGGLAGYASDPLKPPSGEVPDDLALAVNRIVALVERSG
ncbi:MAG: mitochondrial fission ELM1 family protein [Gammaproteobacteria bacterium]|nr:MAG: mitochondrial fission ELM1 family protein [Gammaproteobacteria bacterium]